MQFALYEPCSKDDDTDDKDDDNINNDKNILFLREGAAAVRMVCGVSLFFLFRDIKISFGAFASTDSYKNLFSTRENTHHKMLPQDFTWRLKDIYWFVKPLLPYCQ